MKKLPPKFFRRKKKDGNFSEIVHFRKNEKEAISTHLINPSKGELYAWLAQQEENEREKKLGYEKWPADKLFPLFIEAVKNKTYPPANSTFENYYRAVNHLKEESWWKQTPFKDISTEIALQYIAKHKKSPFIPERDIRFLKQLKLWCIKTEKFKANEIYVPTPVGIHRDDPIGICLTSDNIEKLRATIKESTSLVASLIFELTLARGFRQQEVCKIQKSWVNLEENLIIIPAMFTKNRRSREIPIPKELMQKIKEICVLKLPTDGLFTEAKISPDHRVSLGSWWVNAKKKSGVVCRFHDLRITASTRMAEAGIPETYAMDILGHDQEVRKIYVKILSRKKKSEILDKFDIS